ncbi:MAG: hypothetical protein LUG93_15795 [Lachnospiraceae bacterium]|nr:hypothetical protein [Lachnospiraceae bacterium]
MTKQDFERLCTVVDRTDADDADKVALKHALRYQITVSSLEASLRGGHDYDYIINTALVATRDFYDADSVLFANTDVNLQIAGSLMRELPREGFAPLSGDDPMYLARYPLFLKAIEYGEPVAAPDISQLFPKDSPEYERLREGNVISFMAVPYRKRNTGIVGVVNPHRYQDRIDLLQVLSYVIVAEINEANLMEFMKENEPLTESCSDNEVYIKFINRFEIYNKNGKLTEANLKGNRNVRFLAYLLLNRGHTFSGDELVEILWQGSTTPTNERKALLNLCSEVRDIMRQYFPGEELIVYENYRYGISTKYNIKTDYDEMLALCLEAKREPDISKKIEILGRVIDDYSGALLPTLYNEECLKNEITYFDLKRLEILNTYLELLNHEKRYSEMLEMATRATMRHYDDAKLNYWLLCAYIGCGKIKLARRAMAEKKQYMMPEQMESLEKQIEEIENRWN